MTEASPRGCRSTRVVHRATPIAVLILVILICGGKREPQQPITTPIINSSHVNVVAYLDVELPCQQSTVHLLRELEAENPERVRAGIIDIGAADGRRRWEEAGLDTTAIAIDGNTTVSWGEGDSRRTVSFLHPVGFSWTHDDLRAAISAALQVGLRAADAAESEGVRLVNVTVRGQSIRVGNEGAETGQLVIGERIVLELTAPRGDLSPGRRVSAAAETLTRVLQKPFTPNQLTLERVEDGVAVLAADEQVIVATQADTSDELAMPEHLGQRWRSEMREALVEAARQRPATPPEPAPTPDVPQSPDEALRNPLAPPT